MWRSKTNGIRSLGWVQVSIYELSEVSLVMYCTGYILSFQRSIPKKAKNRKKCESLGQKRASCLPNIDQQVRILQAEIRTKQKETAEYESKFSTGHPGCIPNLFYPNITPIYSRQTTVNLPILIPSFLNFYYSCHPVSHDLSCQAPERSIFSCRNFWTPWMR